MKIKRWEHPLLALSCEQLKKYREMVKAKATVPEILHKFAGCRCQRFGG